MGSATRSRCIGMVSSALMCAAIVGTATAASDEAVIGYRQKVLAATGSHFWAVGDIFKHKLPYGNERIAEHARLLRGSIGMIASAFRQETADIKTDAKPIIWKERDKFEDKLRRLEGEAEKLEKIAASGTPQQIGAQFKKVGLACKSCHDDYRRPQEESWKKSGG